MKEYALRGESLSKVYGSGSIMVHALRDTSFEIYDREFIVVLGPSGSGKSTLLNLLGGMDRPSDGRLWYREKELTGLSDTRLSFYRRDAVGFVFQFFNLIPSLTARENVALAAETANDPMPTDEALSLAGIVERADHFPSQLSGGEQQRVSIARAIVKKPGLLLCDEPTGALDSQNSVAVVRLLLEMRARLGCPVVTITHNAGMAQVADRVFYMRDGKLERMEENSSPVPAEEMKW